MQYIGVNLRIRINYNSSFFLKKNPSEIINPKSNIKEANIVFSYTKLFCLITIPVIVDLLTRVNVTNNKTKVTRIPNIGPLFIKDV